MGVSCLARQKLQTAYRGAYFLRLALRLLDRLLFRLVFRPDFRLPFFFRDGTFPPERRASERPMAIACFRLVTFFPDRPLFSVPCLRSFIARSTFSDAFLPYFAMPPPLLW
jgi:hypothetical protein